MPTPDVLTDIPGKPGRFWGDHTTFVGPIKPACLVAETPAANAGRTT